MVSTVLRKKYKRVHILRRINRFKFYRIVPFIGSDILQPLKMDLSFGKGHVQCGLPVQIILYVNMWLDLFKVSASRKEIKKSTNKISFFFRKISKRTIYIYLLTACRNIL